MHTAVEHPSHLTCRVTLAGLPVRPAPWVGYTIDIEDSLRTVRHERFHYAKAKAALSSVRRQHDLLSSVLNG